MKPLGSEDVIETRNLLIEPITVGHAGKLFSDLQSDKLFKFIPQNPPISIEALEKRYTKWSERQSDDGKEIWLNYAIVRNIDQSYVGTLQSTIELGGKTYIAYEVFPDNWQQGIAKEACQGLIDFLNKKFGVQKITAHIDTRNIASIKLVESLGFEKIDLIKDADMFKGSNSDEFVYELNVT